jgi:hypothetical protein
VTFELFDKFTLLTTNFEVSVVFLDYSIGVDTFFFYSEALGAVEFVLFSKDKVIVILKSYLIFKALFSAA